jgi:hypothetical protein
MNIENLTIKEAREIATLFQNQSQPKISFLQNYVGKYVIVRSRNEGINAGFVKVLDETGIVLTEARRIWYHKPKDIKTSWYEGVAQSGLSDDSKISSPVEKVIIEDYSITVCTDVASNSIQNHKTNEQS